MFYLHSTGVPLSFHSQVYNTHRFVKMYFIGILNIFACNILYVTFHS